MSHKIVNNPPATIFRAYDIRGIAATELTADTVYTLGLAIGTRLKPTPQKPAQVLVARDGRLSGPELMQALISGLLATGCDVIDLGLLPTPMLYFAVNDFKIPNGVVITGSHNPGNYNGLKMVLHGHTLTADEIQQLYLAVCAGDFISGHGELTRREVTDAYINYITADIKLARKLKVVIDCGNGVSGLIAPRLFKALGCEVHELFCEVDGHFPNHHPDPGEPENLQDLIKKVKAVNADIGLAFDGDADRLGVVTNTGEIIYPDRQLIMFARDVLARNPGCEIIFDVKCSRHVAEQVKKFGGKATMWQTGHSLIKAKLKTSGALLAGEMSGHIFFQERWFGFDDGLYAGARMLEIVANQNLSATDLFAQVPQGISTSEISVGMSDAKKFEFMQRLVQEAEFPGAEKITIDGLRVEYPEGWGLVRCSNTSPKLALRFEADDTVALEKIKDRFKQQLRRLDSSLNLDF